MCYFSPGLCEARLGLVFDTARDVGVFAQARLLTTGCALARASMVLRLLPLEYRNLLDHRLSLL